MKVSLHAAERFCQRAIDIQEPEWEDIERATAMIEKLLSERPQALVGSIGSGTTVIVPIPELGIKFHVEGSTVVTTKKYIKKREEFGLSNDI